mgnify:CR=1 FL=1|tara:strand:- start:37 stop:510 length:474 start_codon:yes stop_codon:yes gene_type:complete
MNPTLINGFEDIVEHIKNQEQKIMEFEEFIKKNRVCQWMWDDWCSGGRDDEKEEGGCDDEKEEGGISPKLCKSVYGHKGRKMKTRQSSEFRIRINDNKILYYKSPKNKKTSQPAVVTNLYEKDGNWFYAQSSGHDRQFYDGAADKIVNNHSLVDAAN